MDPSTARTIDTKIKEYAEGVPEGLREDFAQDMWALLLSTDLTNPGNGLASFLNLTLFRARENWLARQRFQARRREEFEACHVEEPQTGADVTLEAEEALQGLVESLSEAFEDYEVEIIVEGLRDGLTQKEIAALLGRTPQGLNYHLKKLHAA